jgi:hypothetical protein
MSSLRDSSARRKTYKYCVKIATRLNLKKNELKGKRVQITFKNKDAQKVQINLEEEEIQVLVEYALVSLVRQGLISMDQFSAQKDFLASLDPNHMPEA